jgi:hypothetical protein
VLQAPDTVEKIPDSLGRHPLCRLAEPTSTLALSREGNRARKPRPVSQRSSSVPLAFCELLDFLLRHRSQPR